MRRTLEISAAAILVALAALAFRAWLASHDEQLRMQTTIAAQRQLIDAADVRERDRASALTQTIAQIDKLKRDVQTPQQILRDLPKYLSLPQPITLTPDPRNSATTAGLNAKGNGTDSDADTSEPGGSQTGPNQARTSAPDQRNRTAGTSLVAVVPSTTPPPQLSTRQGSVRSGRPSANPPNASAGERPTPDRSGSANPNPSTPRNNERVLDDLPDAANQKIASESPTAQIPAADLKPLYDYVQDCRACQAQLAAANQDRSDDHAKLAAMAHERDAALTAVKGGTFWRRFRRNITWFAVGVGAGAATFCATGHCR